jgi:hypothetical protein
MTEISIFSQDLTTSAANSALFLELANPLEPLLAPHLLPICTERTTEGGKSKAPMITTPANIPSRVAENQVSRNNQPVPKAAPD